MSETVGGSTRKPIGAEESFIGNNGKSSDFGLNMPAATNTLKGNQIISNVS